MALLDSIRDKVRQQRYEFSKHAVDQSVLRGIKVKEVEQALLGRSEVVENYSDDERGPSCLVLGFTDTGRALHIQVSHSSRPLLRIITLYEPNPDLWVDFRHRRKTN